MKKLLYFMFIAGVVFFTQTNKSHATTGSSDESLVGSDIKVGRVENIRIIRKPILSTGRVENIKIIRRKKVIGTGITDISADNIVVIKPSSRKHVFVSSGTTTKAILDEGNYTYAINGSYFWKNSSGVFHPAGTMGTSGISKFEYKLCNDPNLCNIYDLQNLIIRRSMFSGKLEGDFRSSGPLLLRNGNIVDNIKNDVSHWDRKAYRTALINNPDPYFIFSTIGFTLPDFASLIKKYFPNGSAINLDGGSSTSFYSPFLRFNSSKTLPEFFLLK